MNIQTKISRLHIYPVTGYRRPWKARGSSCSTSGAAASSCSAPALLSSLSDVITTVRQQQLCNG